MKWILFGLLIRLLIGLFGKNEPKTGNTVNKSENNTRDPAAYNIRYHR